MFWFWFSNLTVGLLVCHIWKISRNSSRHAMFVYGWGLWLALWQNKACLTSAIQASNHRHYTKGVGGLFRSPIGVPQRPAPALMSEEMSVHWYNGRNVGQRRRTRRRSKRLTKQRSSKNKHYLGLFREEQTLLRLTRTVLPTSSPGFTLHNICQIFQSPMSTKATPKAYGSSRLGESIV